MYAEVADVLARAGRVSPAWTETSTPALSDIERFLDARQGEIDAALAGRGVALPLTSETATTALRSLHAAGALVLAIPATFPNREGPAAAAELLQEVRQEWMTGLNSIVQGTHVTIGMLVGEGTVEAPLAESFWDQNPDYGEGVEGYREEDAGNPYFAPIWERGEVL